MNEIIRQSYLFILYLSGTTMGKIGTLPSYNDTSYDANNFNNRSFQNEGRMTGTRGSSGKNDIVPIHEVGYNPQFSKSPLASYQMQRNRSGPTKNLPLKQSHTRDPTDIDYHVNKKGGSGSKCNWKKILCILLAALAIAGLVAGLYFLTDALLSKDKSKNDYEGLTSDGNEEFEVEIEDGVVKPIELNPIPYDPYALQYGTSSSSDSVAGGSPALPNTFPTKPSAPSLPSVPEVPNLDWDALDNSISPIDVYGHS